MIARNLAALAAAILFLSAPLTMSGALAGCVDEERLEERAVEACTEVANAAIEKAWDQCTAYYETQIVGLIEELCR